MHPPSSRPAVSALDDPPQPGAGFSAPEVDPATFHAPLVSGGPFGYQQVNVADQRRDDHSLLNRMERMVRTRKESPEFGFGN